MKNLLFLLSGAMLLLAGGRHKLEDNSIRVNVNEVDELSLQNCDITPLTRNGENLIMGSVTKMIINEEVCAIAANNRLSIFDKTGSFISNIGNVGRANHEYLQLSDFWIEDDHVFVYDINSKRILRYALSDGALIDEFFLPGIVNDEFTAFRFLTPFGNGYVGKCVWNGTGGESPTLAFYDSKFKMIGRLGDLTLNCGLDLGNPLFNAGDEVLYWNALGNIIYSVSEQLQVSPKYTIDFGDRGFPPRESVTDDYELLELYMYD